MVFKAILIGLCYWLGSNENSLPWRIGQFGISDPLVGSTLAGIILGDPVRGVQIGTALEIMYMSNVVIGGAMTADTNSVAWLCSSLAILAKADEGVAVALGATIGVLGAAIFTAYESLASIFYAWGDKAIETGDLKKVWRVYSWGPQLIVFPLRFGLGFLTVMLGGQFAAGVLEAVPELILHIFSVLGSILPAVGLSIMLMYTMKTPKMAVFFLLGVMAVTYVGMNNVGVAVLGVAFAVMHYMYSGGGQTKSVADVDEEDL